MLNRAWEWFCYQAVIYWPFGYRTRRVYLWLLPWAGSYAYRDDSPAPPPQKETK